MPDDVKSPASPLPEGESKPTAGKPAIPGALKRLHPDRFKRT
jgi:hypothetical protein